MKMHSVLIVIWRRLTNSQVCLPYLAHTSGAFGRAYLNWALPEKALPKLKEAAQILSPFAQKMPSVFGDKQAAILVLAVQADSENSVFVCNAMTEAAEVAEWKAIATKIKNDCTALVESDL